MREYLERMEGLHYESDEKMMRGREISPLNKNGANKKECRFPNTCKTRKGKTEGTGS